ncbi:MAG: hypothetical protein F4X11_16635 [Acidobacteria bacterium]|nr:hypothetical protein [Acidobacteriota bacterium]
MFKSNRARWAVVLCFALMGAACGDDPAPTAPTPTPPPAPEPEPEPVMITGEWHGHVHGMLIDGDAHVHLMQTGMDVTGDWHMEEMPEAIAALLMAAGMSTDEELGGPVMGMVEEGEAHADLEFGFAEAFHDVLGHDCVVHAHVEFTEDELEGDWHTDDCVSDDEGDMDLHKEE